MKIAIDKETIKQVKDFSKNKYIYVFDNETIDELKKLKLNCIHKNYVYDKEDIKFLNKKDYKFAIIVPNYNNDHRRI